MTLPAINRQTAQNIVAHRARLQGGFAKVEDLVLVSGVGANKLNLIRGEVCVGGAPGLAEGTNCIYREEAAVTGSSRSRNPSLDSGIADWYQDCRVNVNTAGVTQLAGVKGIGGALAQAIVAQRAAKGPYRTIEGLLKVKGVSKQVLEMVRPRLVLRDPGES